jgi:hypothetical protein
MHFVDQFAGEIRLDEGILLVRLRGRLQPKQRARLHATGFSWVGRRWQREVTTRQELEETIIEIQTLLTGLIWHLKGDPQHVYNQGMLLHAMGYSGAFAVVIPWEKALLYHNYVYAVSHSLTELLEMMQPEPQFELKLPG